MIPFRERPLSVLISIFAVASLASLTVAWVVFDASVVWLNYHVSVWAFLLSWAGLVGYFSRLQFPISIVGTGLLVLGFAVLIRPPVENRIAGVLLSGLIDVRLLSRVAGGLTVALGVSLRGKGKVRRIYEVFKKS